MISWTKQRPSSRPPRYSISPKQTSLSISRELVWSSLFKSLASMVKFASSAPASHPSSKRQSSIQNCQYRRSAKWEMLMWISCVKLRAMSPRSRLCRADFAKRTFSALFHKQQRKEPQRRKSSTYPTEELSLERDSVLIERAYGQVSPRMTNFLTQSTHDELTIQQFHSI